MKRKMVMIFLRCTILYFCFNYFIVGLQQGFVSRIILSNKGTTFIPSHSIESPLKTVYGSSQLRCGQQCNENMVCRTFVHDEMTSICQLYQSDLTSGTITSISGSTSRVGSIQYQPQLYSSFNKICDQCQFSRYLTCQNATCQCPSLTTFWNGQICQNKLYYGDTCNSSTWCRQDYNLSCIFGTCQSNTASECTYIMTPTPLGTVPNNTLVQFILPNGR